MRLIEWILVAFVGAALLFIFAWPVPVDPVAYHLDKNPAGSGVYRPNEALAPLALTTVGGTGPNDMGPEDIARGPDGMLYTGLGSGRILKIDVAGNQSQEFANTHGRPLGLAFDAQGNLIVADAMRGLLSVAPDGTVSILTNEANWRPFKFLNAVAVAPDGKIWFTDTTQRHDLSGVFLDLYEARFTGRLLCYDPATKTTTIALDKLGFANGIAIGPDGQYVLVDESRASRITRYWLTGPRAGKSDIFADNLPGLPDNISYDPNNGLFWVALVLPRTEFQDFLAPHPYLRKLLVRLSELPFGVFALPSPPQTGAWVLAIDTNGKVIESLQNSSGKFAPVTSAHDFGDGGLWLGSVATTAIARYERPLPASPAMNAPPPMPVTPDTGSGS
jgi:sugar lactone lactonase YvrE